MAARALAVCLVAAFLAVARADAVKLAGETCTLTDPNTVTIKCPTSGYFTFATMGKGFVRFRLFVFAFLRVSNPTAHHLPQLCHHGLHAARPGRRLGVFLPDDQRRFVPCSVVRALESHGPCPARSPRVHHRPYQRRRVRQRCGRHSGPCMAKFDGAFHSCRADAPCLSFATTAKPDGPVHGAGLL